MLANLCVESHLRELLEQGFEVEIVTDATAAPRHPDLGDGYQAAMVNYRFLANAVLSTDEAVAMMAESVTTSDLGGNRSWASNNTKTW